MKRLHLLCVCVLLTAVAGCSKGPTTHPVTGKVAFPDGKPMPGGTVVFSNPDAHVSAVGNISEDGTFTLTTLNPGDGAPPGTYRVAIHQAPQADSRQASVPIIHRKYEDDSKSGLSYTVQEGENHFDIPVQRP